MTKLVVLGAGVSGLSTAIRLLEAGYEVEVWTREPPHQTTSSIAAALWHPFRAWPEALVARWASTTYLELVRLAAIEGTGVTLREGLELLSREAADPAWRQALPGFRHAERLELPPGYSDGYRLEVPVVEMPIYLEYLVRRLEQLGGSIRLRTVTGLDEGLELADGVVVCVGLGARDLLGDTTMVPIRGQVVRVEQRGIDRFWLDEQGPGGLTYVVPRSGDCILGGTAEEGEEGLEPDPAVAAAILERCVRLEPRLADARVLGHRVGVRPGRPAVRVALERRPGGKWVVYNYGHGGAGVTLSWGCAGDVVGLVGEGAR